MSKKKKRLIVIIILFVMLLMGAAYTVFIAPMLELEEVHYTEEAVTRGEMIVGVTESGYLEYEIHNITYDLDLTVTEEDEEEDTEEIVQKYLCIEDVYVAAGQQVKEGEPLLKFSEDSVTQVRKLLESALIDARVEYNDAESEYELAVLEAENTLATTATAAKYAQDIYQASVSAVEDEITLLQVQLAQYKSNTAQLEEDVAEATEAYQEAKATYDEIKPAYDATGVEHIDNYLVIRNNYANAKSTYERAEQSLEQAKEALESNKENIQKVESQLEEAKALKNIQKLESQQSYEEAIIAGENGKYSYEATLESLEEDIKTAEEDKKTLEEKLQNFEALVGEDGILYAPDTGKITEVTYQAGDTLERAGNLFAYIMEDGMAISVDVTQEDIVSLAVGDGVSIEFTAYEGEVYEGTIYSIDTTATSVDTPAISYTVNILVSGSLEKIYGGMSANITFVTETKEDTLSIPRRALMEENGEAYVYVKTLLGDKEKRKVEVGIRNENMVEILSGLTEEDKVFVISYENE